MPWEWDQPWFTISAVAFAALLVGLYMIVLIWLFRMTGR